MKPVGATYEYYLHAGWRDEDLEMVQILHLRGTFGIMN